MCHAVVTRFNSQWTMTVFPITRTAQRCFDVCTVEVMMRLAYLNESLLGGWREEQIFFLFSCSLQKYISRKQRGVWQQMKHWLPMGNMRNEIKTESGAKDWKRKHCINQLAVGFFGPASHGPQCNFELVVEVSSFQLAYFPPANTKPESCSSFSYVAHTTTWPLSIMLQTISITFHFHHKIT